MKKAKKLAIILVALVMVLSIALAACKDEPSHDYTVKVVGPDGKPYTTAQVQPCLVGADGELDMCYEGVATNDQGIAYLDIGKEIPTEDANEIEIHLLGLPSTLTYQPIRMKKGETKTIQLTQVQSGPNLKTPLSGTGTGSYENDWSTGDPTNNIDLDNFDPYVVTEGPYLLKFNSADQKIFYAFKANEAAKYKVYSEGEVDAAVLQLIGNLDYGFSAWRGEGFDNDNVSATDNNFYYEFDVEESAVQNGVYTYFEVSLSNPDDVGKEAVINFKYASEGQGGQDDVINVYPENPLDEYKMIGDYVDAPIDGSAVYVVGDDGYYHLGDANGPVLVATLGTDKDVNSKHTGNDVAPRGLEIGFTKIVAQGAGLTIYDDGKGYNYIPMVTAYTEASNSEGRYPLTAELITFLNGYLVNSYGLEWFEENSGLSLPEVDPWLVWCGYYDNPYEEEVGGGGSESDGSDEENAIMLLAGRVTVNVPQGGSVYFSYYSMGGTTLTILPYTLNSKLTVYTQSQGSAGAKVVELTGDEIQQYEIEISAGELYYLLFSTLDGEAEMYDILVVEEEPEAEEGTELNPKQITFFGEFADELDSVWSGGVYYEYTVGSDVSKLYFACDENTKITVIYNGQYLSSLDEEDMAKLKAGIDVEEGATITIIVDVFDFSAESLSVSFTISNVAIDE